MKKQLVALSFLLFCCHSFAAVCPDDKSYEEMQSYGTPENEKEKRMLIEKMSTDLKAKYPNTFIHCDFKDNKSLYCAACNDS